MKREKKVTGLSRASLGLAIGLLALLGIGCGSSHSETATRESEFARHPRYFKALRAISAPLGHNAASAALNRKAAAGENPQAARAGETLLPELRVFLRKLKRLAPPPQCAPAQTALEKLERANVYLLEGVLPLYRHNQVHLIRVYERHARRIIGPIQARREQLEGPC